MNVDDVIKLINEAITLKESEYQYPDLRHLLKEHKAAEIKALLEIKQTILVERIKRAPTPSKK